MCRPTHGLWDVKWGGDLKPAPRTGLDNEQQGAGNSGSTKGWAGGGGTGPLKAGKGASGGREQFRRFGSVTQRV